MSRNERFKALKNHIWYGKLIRRLRDNDRQAIRHFILKYENASPADWAKALDKTIDDPNFNPTVAEILTVINREG